MKFNVVVPVRTSKGGQPQLIHVEVDDPRLIKERRKAVIDKLIDILPEGIHYFEVTLPGNK